MPLTRELSQSDPIRPGVAGTQQSIDFRCLPHQGAEIQKIREACLTAGFFYVDHAFEDKSIVGDTLLQMDNFFGLDDDDVRKKEVSVSATNKHGWTPMFGEPAYQPGTIAHLESFDCGRPFQSDGNSPKNIWPDLANFRGDVRQCWNALTRIGDVVLESLALAAGVAPRTFGDRCDSYELSTMRLLHYPANNAPVAEKNVGIAAHTDFECMTLILQTAPGLELRDATGSWYDAPPDENRVVVLLGDMLERWTNGQFQATGHRVRNTNDSRYSIVLFFAVNDDELVSALPEFVSDDNPARHKPVGQRQHLNHEVKRAERYRDEDV
jgi:isopenicillin N synthase-like dioxygenase